MLLTFETNVAAILNMWLCFWYHTFENKNKQEMEPVFWPFEVAERF